LDEATARCAAVIMVGGHSPRRRGRKATTGALAIVNRFIEQRKPAFPIPFSGGQSDEVFQEVLARWAETPVPGLSRTQFLRLALPWTTGTGDLGDLLFGTLTDKPDVFISYRRADTAWVAGRLHRDLSEHFGAKCVFMDIEDITAGDVWKHTIEHALEHCRVGVVVIGRQWLDAGDASKPRLLDEHDVVRREIRALLDAGKPVIVVLAGAAPPMAVDLPEDLWPLVERQAVAITNATWPAIVGQVIATIGNVTSGLRPNA
jgi:TIR domain-containing protein